MTGIQDSSHSYEPSTKASLEPCADFVPDMLYDFIVWLTNVNLYRKAAKCNDAEACKDDMQAITLCHNIIAKCRQVRTPITMGLGLYAHHEFGSKQLVEILSKLGLSITYDEVRRFLTSVAIDQQNDSSYVPRGLSINDGTPIDAAIDNFDQNEDTLDGKATTHAMAAVVYKRSQYRPADGDPLPRVNKKSLTVDTSEGELQR